MTAASTDGTDVVDTHVHFWDRRRTDLEYDWLDGTAAEAVLGDLDGLRTVRYSVPELRAETRMHGVAQVVHMSAAELERHLEHDRLRGVRDMRPGSVLADAGFRRGYARLAGAGLVFCHTVGVEHPGSNARRVFRLEAGAAARPRPASRRARTRGSR